MKTNQFKAFANAVAAAGMYDDVWYCGYLWTALTRNQAAKIRPILDANGHVNLCMNFRLKRYEYVLPSGIRIWYDFE